MFSKNIVAVLEFDEQSIRMVIVENQRKLLKVLQTVEEPIVEEENPSETSEPDKENEQPVDKTGLLYGALERVFNQMKYKPVCFSLSVPSSLSIVRTLMVPFRGARKVVSALRFELEPHIPFPIEELLLDFTVVSEDKKETEVLALGVRRQHIEEYIRCLEEFSARPECAVINSLGLVYLWRRVSRNKQKLKAGLLIGKKSSVIAVLHEEKLVFVRHLILGVQDCYENPEQVIREVQNSLRAFLARWKGKESIDTIEIGGVPLTDEDREVFSKLLKLNVESVALSSCIQYPEHEEETWDAVWDPLVGIAGVTTDPKFSFNLLKEEQKLPNYLGYISRHLIFTNCLILTFLVVSAFFLQQISLSNLVQASIYKADAEFLSQEIEKVNQEKGLDENINLSPFFEPPLLEILNTISEKLPSNRVNITEIKIAPPEMQSYWIRIQGTTNDASFIMQAIEDLKQVEFLSNIEEPELSAQGNQTNFAIKIQRPLTSGNVKASEEGENIVAKEVQ